MKIINVYARTRQGANILGRKIHKWNKDRTGLTRPDPKRFVSDDLYKVIPSVLLTGLDMITRTMEVVPCVNFSFAGCHDFMKAMKD